MIQLLLTLLIVGMLWFALEHKGQNPLKGQWGGHSYTEDLKKDVDQAKKAANIANKRIQTGADEINNALSKAE